VYHRAREFEWLFDFGEKTRMEDLTDKELSDLGDAANKAKDYVSALKHYLAAMKMGNSHGSDMVGYYYEKGLGVQVDLQKAFDCYEQASEKGNPSAMFSLSLMYHFGEIVAKNDEKAYEWMLKSYKSGFRGGTNDTWVGFFLETGTGVEKNLLEAINYYTEAADRGDDFAKERLAEIRPQKKSMHRRYKDFRDETDYYRELFSTRVMLDGRTKPNPEGDSNLVLSIMSGSGPKEEARKDRWGNPYLSFSYDYPDGAKLELLAEGETGYFDVGLLTASQGETERLFDMAEEILKKEHPYFKIIDE
jgi:TPR repeat protein